MGLYRQILLDSPTLLWALDEASGSIAQDLSGNVINGTHNNSPTLGATGLMPVASAVTYNGTSQYTLSATSASLPKGKVDFTFEIVFSTTYTAGFACIACLRDNTGDGGGGNSAIQAIFALGRTAGHLDIETWAWSAGGSSTRPDMGNVADGKTHHVVGVYTSADDTMRTYLDGVAATSASQAGIGINSTNNRLICVADNYGATPTPIPNPTQYFPGTVAFVAVYNSALSATRVAVHNQELRRTGVVVG